MVKQKGFTLIELMIIIAIIGLLSTASFVAFEKSRSRARDTRRMADLKQIYTALEYYYDKFGQYPSEVWCDSSLGSLEAACGSFTGDNWNYSSPNLIGLQLRNNNFLKNLPKDPKNNSTYFYVYEPDCAQNGCPANKCCKYELGATLERGGWYTLRNGSNN